MTDDNILLWIYDEPWKFILGIVIIICMTYLWLQRRKCKSPPRPSPSWPLIGHLMGLGKGRFFEVLTAWSKKYGDVYEVHLGMKRAIVLSSLEKIQEALVTKQNDFADKPRSFTTDLFSDNGKGIFGGNVDATWQMLRKIAHNAIKKYASGKNLEECSLKSLDQVISKMRLEEGPFNPKEHITNMICNIICGMIFGTVYDYDDPEFKKLLTDLDYVNELFSSGLPEDFFPFLQYIYTSDKSRKARALAEGYRRSMAEKLEEHKKNYNPDNLYDITDFLISTQKKMTDTEDPKLVERVCDAQLTVLLADFYSAGIDTSRETMYWVICELAVHPDVQRKMQNQIDEVCGSRPVSIADRSNLPYVEAVFMESLRLGLAGPVGIRSTSCSTSIGSYDIPKDTMIMVNYYALCHDERYFEEPEKFQPERFLDPDGKLLPKPNAFMPFSVGRRTCLGETLVKSELNLLIASLYQRLNIEAAPGIPIKAELSDNSIACTCKLYQVVVSQRE